MQTETEFLAAAEAEMEALESWLEDSTDGEVECLRSGHVLTIELDDGRQVVVNIQTPMKEIWFASPFGGRHFAFNGATQQWEDTRTQSPLASVIQEALTQMGVDFAS